MKHLLLTTIAAVLLVGCATQAKQLSSAAESKLNDPITEVPAQSSKPLSEADKALIDAALTGNIEAAKQAIVDDANVNVKGSGRWTPVHFATWGGYKEVVKLLIAKDADLNAEDVNGKTPLDWSGGEEETADLLRKYGGKTSEELSIHVAAERGNITVFKQHLAAGANVNAKDRAGKTPLDRAITNYQTETADIIRKHGGKTAEELKAEGK
jgi:ankyrin repeat protein